VSANCWKLAARPSEGDAGGGAAGVAGPALVATADAVVLDVVVVETASLEQPATTAMIDSSAIGDQRKR
jgi:hypothetical protein